MRMKQQEDNNLKQVIAREQLKREEEARNEICECEHHREEHWGGKNHCRFHWMCKEVGCKNITTTHSHQCVCKRFRECEVEKTKPRKIAWLSKKPPPLRVDIILVDVILQALGDDEGNIDNRCISVYEDATEYLAYKGLIKKINDRIYKQIS